MMNISVRFVDTAKKLAGTHKTSIELEAGATIDTLRKVLASKYPGLADRIDAMQMAIDDDFARSDQAIPDGSEISVIPNI